MFSANMMIGKERSWRGGTEFLWSVSPTFWKNVLERKRVQGVVLTSSVYSKEKWKEMDASNPRRQRMFFVMFAYETELLHSVSTRNGRRRKNTKLCAVINFSFFSFLFTSQSSSVPCYEADGRRRRGPGAPPAAPNRLYWSNHKARDCSYVTW